MRTSERFTEAVSVLYPPKVAEQLKLAAERSVMTASEYTRRSVIDRLRADGYDPAPPNAAELYNVIEGKRQFALVEGNEVLSISPRSTVKPDDGKVWLPVEYEDDQPYNPLLHYRHAPIARIDGERVVRTYQVRLKSQEDGI